MADRPSILERAFALAETGRVNSVAEIRTALKSEGYSDQGHLQGPAICKQLMKTISVAKAKNDQ
jgi:hypothetical protein